MLYRADKSYLYFAVLVPEVKHPACYITLEYVDYFETYSFFVRYEKSRVKIHPKRYYSFTLQLSK